jgi:Putative auto-transporter adhesin, head GIN domain
VLSILWVASIISFFYATPFTSYIFSNGFTSFLASTNIFLLISIPLFSLLMFLIRKTFRTSVVSNLRLRAGLWVLWVVNLVSLLFFGITESRNFNMGTTVSRPFELSDFTGDTIYFNNTITKGSNSLVTLGPLKLADNGLINEQIHYRFVRSENGRFEMEQNNSSRGRTLAEAESYAQAISYNIEQQGNTISFPTTFPIPKGSKYRGQEVEVIVKVPVGKTIKMQEKVSNKIWEFDQNDEEDAPWVHDGEYYWTMEDKGFVAKAYIQKNNQQKSYNSITNFTQLQIDGRLEVTIEQSNEFDIQIKSKDAYWEDLEVEQIGDILSIRLDQTNVESPPKVSIKMPKLLAYDGSQTADVNISGFSQPKMRLKSDGDHHLRAYVTIDSLTVLQEDQSTFDLRGKGRFLKAIVNGDSNLEADRYTVKTAEVNMQYSNNVAVSVLDTLYRKGEPSQMSDHLKVEGEPALVDLEER